ncbi:hypothetical protein FSP39_001668 [Pinctada imbricata]|uniref:Uncharacterized protein n=1 Tax=Pinctada imbricata TaxID=66713 RepID=A0AA89C0B4_PINIB|nr:hypothetical protein FSP39_001668 [Pinctada imbricata]
MDKKVRKKEENVELSDGNNSWSVATMTMRRTGEGKNRHLCQGLFVTILCVVLMQSALAEKSGCADGSESVLKQHNKISVCPGKWTGHIRNATHLCSPGWKVCSFEDYSMLRDVRWEHATSFEGCYAINAAHDGGKCRECREDLNRDDLAGIGRGCPHQNYGQTSCISGGRIDASCCVDAHFQEACHHRPGIITGVVCCKIPTIKPRIIVKPRQYMEVNMGLIFLLTCQASGSPLPRVKWYKDGREIRSNRRIQALSSGDLLVTLAKPSDSGLYSCEVINEAGMDVASSQVVVKAHSSGCRDGSTDGLNIHRDVHACTGSWEGHVKKARKTLCQRGWRVCSPRDRDSLQKLTWLDIFDLNGCYAYNAANKRGCKRCTNGRMAGVGRNCGRMRYSKFSCLAQGQVDVFKPQDRNEGCSYKEGVTTGVLCCRKKHKRETKYQPFTCKPECLNGGKCVSHNLCRCTSGYKGAMCQNPVCDGGCGKYGRCIRPGKCKCKKGYSGKNCLKKKRKMCRRPCLNGGRCRRGRCKCPPSHWGKTCQHCKHQY